MLVNILSALVWDTYKQCRVRTEPCTSSAECQKPIWRSLFTELFIINCDFSCSALRIVLAPPVALVLKRVRCQAEQQVGYISTSRAYILNHRQWWSGLEEPFIRLSSWLFYLVAFGPVEANHADLWCIDNGCVLMTSRRGGSLLW